VHVLSQNSRANECAQTSIEYFTELLSLSVDLVQFQPLKVCCCSTGFALKLAQTLTQCIGPLWRVNLGFMGQHPPQGGVWGGAAAPSGGQFNLIYPVLAV
jgi:hypothetical protein